MNIINYIYMAALSLLPQSKPAYSTIVYPTRGEGVVVHDGLGIHEERPWYSLPKTDVAPVPVQPQEAHISAAEASDDAGTSVDVVDPTWSSDDSIAPHQPSSFWNSLTGIFDAGGISTFSKSVTGTEIVESPQFLGVNPATGMQMLDTGFDVGGNVFGVDTSSSDFGGSDFMSFDGFGSSDF